MQKLNPGLSSDAVLTLFGITLRAWSDALGQRGLARRMGVSQSRLSRGGRSLKGSFDLAYRLHRTCGLSWTDIFLSPFWYVSAGFAQEEKVEAVLRRDPSPPGDAEVDEAEAATRKRLKAVIRERGIQLTAKAIGIPTATLHTYFVSTRLPLSLIWRLHLLAGIPFSKLTTGALTDDEAQLNRFREEKEDMRALFPNDVEPIVRLVEVYLFGEVFPPARPYVPMLERLRRSDLTVPQASRLGVLLAMCSFYASRHDKAADYMRWAWSKVKGRKRFTPGLLYQAAVSGHIGLFRHGRKICRRILELTESPGVVSQVLRIQCEAAQEQYRFSEAFDLARNARSLISLIPPGQGALVSAQVEGTLALNAWLQGDPKEASWRARRLIEDASVAPVMRRYASELEINIRLHLNDFAGVRRAFRTMPTSSSPFGRKIFGRRVRLYQLWTGLVQSRPLSAEDRRLLREGPGTGPWSEPHTVHAICSWLGLKNLDPMRAVLKRLASPKGFIGRPPLFTLPEFIRIASETKAWTRGSQRWLQRLQADGFLFFGPPKVELTA